MDEFNYYAQQGWQCPICKRVYSPSTLCCFYCGAESKVTTSTSARIDWLKPEDITSADLDIGGYTFSFPLEEEDDTLGVKGEEE